LSSICLFSFNAMLLEIVTAVLILFENYFQAFCL
jgi:hypothetical protein